MDELAKQFKQKTGHTIVVAYGSTGKHYAQIKNGAPFDLFFAADTLRPFLLEQEGLTIKGSRFTYAVGQLVLWGPNEQQVDSAMAVFLINNAAHIAIANPKLAPYGKAAMEVLQRLNLWDTIKDKLVRGENITQAFQYVVSGSAETGFVAFSQIINTKNGKKGSFWNISQNLYSPIRQQAVLLKENSVVQQFIRFVKSDTGQQIIKSFGYETGE